MILGCVYMRERERSKEGGREREKTQNKGFE
jgi:hypothetical protein